MLLPPSPSHSEASCVSDLSSAASEGNRSKALVKSLLRRGALQPRVVPPVQFVPLGVEAQSELQSVASVLKPVPKGRKQVGAGQAQSPRSTAGGAGRRHAPRLLHWALGCRAADALPCAPAAQAPAGAGRAAAQGHQRAHHPRALIRVWLRCAAPGAQPRPLALAP